MIRNIKYIITVSIFTILWSAVSSWVGFEGAVIIALATIYTHQIIIKEANDE